jgi:Ribosomal RNA adenine dimethylase
MIRKSPNWARLCAEVDEALIMYDDRQISAHADPKLEQHFLVSAEKLSKLIAAAGIRPADNVLEVGAGIGTVARKLPESNSLIVVELDKRLIETLRGNVPHAKVMQGDALEIIQNVLFDVLISNLPDTVTESLIGLLPGLSFRTAILAVGESTDLDQLGRVFSWSEVTRISGDDFLPPQPSVSRIVKIVPKTDGRVGVPS